MKHIQIDLHFACDQVQKGTLKASHVHTQDQLGALLTKPLSLERTESLRAKIDLANGSSILQGHIKELRKVTQSKNQFQIDKKSGSDLQQQSGLESCLVSWYI